jgi:polyisoprenoid-binding protein YceI
MDKHDTPRAQPPSAYDPTEGAQQERWVIDPVRSPLTFSLRHIVVQRINGRFGRWGGTLYIDRGQPSLSSAEVWIDLASITTGDPQRDEHVRSAEFLDVEQFPRAVFRSELVQVRDHHVTIDGRLALHGLSRDVRVEVDIGRTEKAAGGQMRGHYTARATLDRQAFGLHWNQDLDVGGIVVADQVDIRAEIEVVRVADDDGHGLPRRG